MSGVSEITKYKAQVYDVALNAFFKLREFDSEALGESKREVGWAIAEALVAAAVSGVTYKTRDSDHLFEAASLLRSFADRVEEDGLGSLEWGYQGKLDARQAWRPDIRMNDGLAEVDKRTDAIIEGMMRPLRALTSAERRAIVCMSFVRMALVHVGDLINEHPEEATQISSYIYGKIVPEIDKLASIINWEGNGLE